MSFNFISKLHHRRQTRPGVPGEGVMQENECPQGTRQKPPGRARQVPGGEGESGPEVQVARKSWAADGIRRL